MKTKKVTCLPIVQDRKLSPLNTHQGPVLKLTKKEQALVNRLREEISQLMADAYKLDTYRDSKVSSKTWSKRNEYSYIDKSYHLESNIDRLRKQIKDIMVARYSKQKEQFEQRQNKKTKKLDITG